ncbi:Gypsy retrotransposon integrase-like protein 1, partial [Mucuna pruriens]
MENDKRTLRRLVACFFLSGVILYKRSADSSLLHYVDNREAQEIMEEVHEGTFDTHINAHALARKILRADYYWTKMESNYCQHMRRCMKCQAFVDNIHVAPSALHNLACPWSFSMWGLYMIGPIESKASNENRFVLVAIDYFTKWVEATSYASVTKNVVVKFIKRDIICQYGLPAHIITDNGTNLKNKMMTELYEQFKIKHHNSTPYCPKMNGAVEAANKNIKKIVCSIVCDDVIRETVSAYDVSFDELDHYAFCYTSVRHGFYPLCEVVNGHQNEPMSIGRLRLYRTNHIQAPHGEWPWGG